MEAKDLRQQRQRHRMSQARLSRLSRVSRFRISLFENEALDLRDEELNAINVVFQRDLERLVHELRGTR